MQYFRYLLIFVPLAFLASAFLHNQLLNFIFAAGGLIALSSLIGDAIEALSAYTSPKISALLNATLGNAAELIITIVALKAGQVELVKAALMGAVLGNILVIPGLAMLLGGLKNGKQYFKNEEVSQNTTMMSLAVVGLFIPTIFEILREVQHHTTFTLSINDPELNTLSLGVAVTLLIVYLLGLLYSFTTTKKKTESGMKLNKNTSKKVTRETTWGLPLAISILIGSSLAMIFLSDILVGAVEHMVKNFGLNELFIGIILIPLVGDVAEHIVGVQQGIKNNMELALSISMESAAQIVLFVTPVLVFASKLMGHEMNLFFSPLEIIVLALGVFIAGQMTEDSETNWLEGVQLLAVYVLAALGFFLL